MMSRRMSPIVLLLALAAVLSGCQGGLQAYDLPLPGKQVDPDDGYQVVAEFNDVVDVVPRTLVLINDVPVGQVDKVERIGWHAKVTMTLRKDIVLPADAEADVRKTSLLGEKYIALLESDETSGSANTQASGTLRDGSVIPLDRTGRNPDVEEVLGALSFLLSRGGVGQLKTISTELNAMMNGRTDDLRSVLGRLDEVVGTLDQSKSSVIKAMEQVDRLTATLNEESGTIQDAIESFGPALEVLHQQHDDLVSMLEALDKLGVVATRVVNQSGDNIAKSLALLRPSLTELAAAGDAFPRGLMLLASFPFPKQAATLAKGNYSNALFHMEFDFNQIVQGLLTGDNTGLPQLLQICQVYSPDCAKIQPLAQALCQLTNVDLACSVQQSPFAATSAGEGQPPGTGKAAAKAAPLPPVDDLTREITRSLTVDGVPLAPLSPLLNLLGGGAAR